MKYKRILAVMTVVSLLFCGCQSQDTYDAEFNAQETAQSPEPGAAVVPVGEDTLTTKAKIEKLTKSPNMNWAWQFTPTAEGFACIGDCTIDGTKIFHYNIETSEWTETILVPLASYDGYYFTGGVMDFGEDAYYQLGVMENHRNMEPYRDGDEDFDWEAYNETYESDYFLCTYAADGTLAGKVQIQGLEEYKSQDYDQFSSFYCDGENAFLSLRNGTVLRIHADGMLEETVPATEDWIHIKMISFLRDRDGKPVCLTNWDETNADMSSAWCTSFSDFDVQTGKPGEPFYTAQTSYSDTISSIFSGGYGEYRLFVTEAERTSAGMHTQKLYGIRDDGTKEVVIDWDESDMDSMSVMPLSDGTFIGDSPKDEELYRVSRRYASEIKERQTITVGVLDNDYYLKDFTQGFNRSQDTYKLEIITYPNSDGSYFGDPEGKNDALDNLKLAVVSNDAPDMLFMQGESDYHDTFLRLGSKGVFCDLYEFIDNDAEVNRDTLLPNILTAMQHPNGSLYSFTRGFWVQTLAVKPEYSTKENWTMDDMIALYEGADDMKYYWSTKQEMLQMLLTGTDFTDEMNGTCSFDSPEFIKMLEFCNRYPLETTCPEKSYEDPDQEARWMKWINDHYHRYIEDNDYLYHAVFSSLTGGFAASRYAYDKAELGGAMTLVGYPSDNGKGGRITADGEIAILSTCSDKAAAWEVLKAYIQNEIVVSEYTGYSVFNDVFEEELDMEMYILDFGERSDAEYYDNQGTHIYPLTQEERDGLEDYIRGCDTYMMLDEKVKNIIYEEAGMYFSGDRSVEDTAKMIQSRAEIYLSEQS